MFTFAVVFCWMGKLDEAEQKGDSQTVLKAIREIRQTLELSGKILGELGKQKPPSQHLHLSLSHVSDAVLERMMGGQDEENMPCKPNRLPH